MASTADTLTATGAPVTLAPPPPEYAGSTPNYPYAQNSFAVMGSNPDEILIAWDNTTGNHQYISGYDLSGTLLFQDDLQSFNVAGPGNHLELATIPGGDVAASWLQVSGGMHGVTATAQVEYSVVAPDGSMSHSGFAEDSSGAARTLRTAASQQTLSTSNGFALEWQDKTSAGQAYTQLDRYQADGAVISNNAVSTAGPLPYANIALQGLEFSVVDNQAQLAGQTAVTVPGEPAHAMTQVVAAALTDGHSAAVAWVDSGTDYVSIYNASSNSFGPAIGLDWGGAKDLHTVALGDGGFAVSWENGGAYKGELFAADGTGGGVLSLTGQFAALDSHGELYTVGVDSNGDSVVQTYAVNGTSGGSGSGGGTGGGGTGGTGGGATYTSDNAGDHWTGTTADETFNLGRGGDVVTGGGGNDTFKFAETPWAGAHITDFNNGDQIDLNGLLAASGYSGSDPVGAGYLKITTDSQGNGQIWSDLNQPGNAGWWLVTTVDGVSGSQLQINNGVVTETPAPSHAVSTSDPNYVAPAYVDSITLTGSHQTVHASNFDDTTIWSNNTGNTIYGGTGDDTIHIGRGGDTVSGSAGRDVFVFDDIPWARATITDIATDRDPYNTAGDTIDVTGILAKAGYTGSDPVADGYLKQTHDNSGYHIWANYNQPGNDSWWEVVTYAAPTALTLTDGVYHAPGAQSGTWTTSTGGTVPTGYDGAVMTGSNGSLGANHGGNILVDQGSNNDLFGWEANDTFVLSPTTKSVDTRWGGFDTIVLNAHPAVNTLDTLEALATGDRIDLHPLLQGMGYTGSEPIAEGYIKVDQAPPAFGQMGRNLIHVEFDPDGPGGSAPWSTALTLNGYTPLPHYSDGWLIV
jgi:hypothetical protein